MKIIKDESNELNYRNTNKSNYSKYVCHYVNFVILTNSQAISSIRRYYKIV